MTDVFPGVGNDGCFFHLSKRLDYHVKQFGLMVKYTDNVAFRICVKCLAALAFLTVTDVIPAFESLAITFFNDELPLLSLKLHGLDSLLGDDVLPLSFLVRCGTFKTVPRPDPPGQRTHSYPANTLLCGSYS